MNNTGYGWLHVTAIIGTTRAHECNTELRVTKCNRATLPFLTTVIWHLINAATAWPVANATARRLFAGSKTKTKEQVK